MTEVLQLVERNYRGSDVRACMGLSSGGQGCVTYAARRRGAFRYAASYSGILSLGSSEIRTLLLATNLLNLTDPFRIWGIPGVDEANWRAHDPVVLAPRLRGTGLYISSGATGRPGPLDDSDAAVGGVIEVPIGKTNIAFRKRLRQLHIPVTAHLYGPGTHSWPYWNREMKLAFPALMRAIGATRVTSSV